MDISPLRLIRLPEVLNRVPVSKSTWWAGVASGRFPKPVRLGPRATAWLEQDINNLIMALVGRGRESDDLGSMTYRPHNLSENSKSNHEAVRQH